MKAQFLLIWWLSSSYSLPNPGFREDQPDLKESEFPAPMEIDPRVKYAFGDCDALEENTTLACDESNAPGRHMIYCSGKLLHAVMATHVYPDSKTFVDRPMRRNHTGDQILSIFKERFPEKVEQMNREQIAQFIEEFFEPEGHELIGCELKDWKELPPQIAAIVDPTLRGFALDLHKIWRQLCRRVDPLVEVESHRFSLIHVPHPFIVPGGRFRENYYWDTFWIVKGLLVSGMAETVRGMIRNFAFMVDTYGFVPNGGRIYYLQRSQPPMLSPMVYEYYQATKDKEFVKDLLPILEKEYLFWKNHRNITITLGEEQLTLYQYRTPLRAPRPESYREDMLTAADFENIEQKKDYFQNLASAAESGWDFSTRWFREKSSLQTIETINILPVDLNAFICYNMQIITYLHGEIGNVNKEFKWMTDYLQFRQTFQKVFYVRRNKGWYDFNLELKEHNFDFYPSMAVPLFTQCYDPLGTKMFEEVYDKMEELGAFNFTGGVPTSLRKDSNQQWDFPNGWSPLNHMIIEGLRKSGNSKLQQRAFQLAEKWIFSNFNVFQRDRQMWEKYDVVSTRTQLGNGGEYSVQAGFGWTNGVILDLLSSYSDRVRFPNAQPPIVPVPVQFRGKQFMIQSSSSSSFSTGLYALLVLSFFL